MGRLAAIILCIALLVAGCSEPQNFHSTNISGVEWGKDFNLTDHNGQPRRLADFRGKVVVLFFGYTQCPDVCPTTLASMRDTLKVLGDDGARVRCSLSRWTRRVTRLSCWPRMYRCLTRVSSVCAAMKEPSRCWPRISRSLQPRRLEELGLQQFDAWAATFGESVTALEIAPDGSGYRMHTRFARFINVPELMTVFGEVADIRTAEMLNLPVPKLRGDKPRTVACPASPALKAYVQTLVQRAEATRNGAVDPRQDNMLAVTNGGRQAALDFRLIAPTAAFDPKGKVAACIDEVWAIWEHTAEFRGAQLVFCDLSAPKGGKAFSVYDDKLRLRRKMFISRQGYVLIWLHQSN